MRIAVTGANGRIGRQVVDTLAVGDTDEVVAVVRRATTRARPRVSEAVADYDDEATLCEAFRDVDTLVFVSSDGEGAKVLMHHRNIIRAAAASGVSHIVALSGLDADSDSPFCYAVTYAYTERLLAESGCQVSIARASVYAEFFLNWLLEARQSGQLRVPAGNGRISLVARGDIARSLSALTTGSHGTGIREITGAEPLDMPALARLADDVWGTQIEYDEVTPEEFRAELVRTGEEPWWQYAYSTLFDSIREHRWETVTNDIQHLTGLAPTPLRTILEQHDTTHESS